jgi:hypothetical protein
VENHKNASNSATIDTREEMITTDLEESLEFFDVCFTKFRKTNLAIYF